MTSVPSALANLAAKRRQPMSGIVATAPSTVVPPASNLVLTFSPPSAASGNAPQPAAQPIAPAPVYQPYGGTVSVAVQQQFFEMFGGPAPKEGPEREGFFSMIQKYNGWLKMQLDQTMAENNSLRDRLRSLETDQAEILMSIDERIGEKNDKKIEALKAKVRAARQELSRRASKKSKRTDDSLDEQEDKGDDDN